MATVSVYNVRHDTYQYLELWAKQNGCTTGTLIRLILDDTVRDFRAYDEGVPSFMANNMAAILRRRRKFMHDTDPKRPHA